MAEKHWQDWVSIGSIIGGAIIVSIALAVPREKKTPLQSLFSRPISKPISSQARNQPTHQYKFPLRSCGERNPGGVNNWYPVFVNYSERNLKLIRSKYCGDAYTKYREAIGLHSIQTASFMSRKKAEEFAEIMKQEVGSGEVGEPTQCCR